MTTENLHHEADIAEQLAWRDKRIAELEALFQQTHGVHWSWVAKEAEQRKRIEDLETELSAYKAVAKERGERLQVTADWVDQNLSDMQVFELKQALELPQRPQDGDDATSHGEDDKGGP